MHQRTVPILLTISILCLTSAATAQLSGSVEFGGPGAEQLPTTTFVPTSYEGDPPGWAFLDELNGISVLLIQSEETPSDAGFVGCGVVDGPSWLALSLSGSVTGVEIDGDTVTFTDVILTQSAKQRVSLILNGKLTRPKRVPVEQKSLSRLKTEFGGAP